MEKLRSTMKILPFKLAVIVSVASSAFAYEIEQYYPLGQGDSWTYTTIEDEKMQKVTLKIEGEQIIDGKSAVKVFFRGDKYQLMGLDSEGVKIYKDFSEDECEVYSPPMINVPHMAMGENKEYSFVGISYDLEGKRIEEGHNTIKVRLEAIEDVKVVAGKFSGCLRYRSMQEVKMENRDFIERMICTVWLAPDVGMIKKVCVEDGYNEEEKKPEISTQQSELISALVGGKQIERPEITTR